jgi:chromosome partitioning protein
MTSFHTEAYQMGKIILIGGEKGGSGKSTTATNIAVCLMLEGHDVMLLDADKQATATKFITRRNDAGYKEVHSAQKLGDIYKTAIDLSSRYEFVIIDAGGRDSRELRTGMVAADLVYVPIKASQADLETLPVVDELLSLSRGMNPTLRARALLCMAPTNERIREVQDAQELLKDFPDLPLSGCIIRERKIYRDALLLGRGVVEMKNNDAKAEIQLLVQEMLA